MSDFSRQMPRRTKWTVQLGGKRDTSSWALVVTGGLVSKLLVWLALLCAFAERRQLNKSLTADVFVPRLDWPQFKLI